MRNANEAAAGLLGIALALGVAPAQAQTATEVVLHNFYPATGDSPGGVVRDPAGNLYGSTEHGGTDTNRGVIFKLDTAGHYTVLHSFIGAGAHPSDVTLDSVGNLYGTTPNGGTNNVGEVFKLDPAGQFTVLYSFTGGTNGSEPLGGVIRDSADNLYGTAGMASGGDRNGKLYKLDEAGNYTVLYSFTGGSDGSTPTSLTMDSVGNLYGATFYGGASGYGTVFKLSTAGQLTILYSFTGGADGGCPCSGLTLDSVGNLYGAAAAGGTANQGVVFGVSPSGLETVLYSFTGIAKNPGFPYAAVILDPGGNLYGTTPGAYGTSSAGVVYKLDTAGNWTVLYNFSGGADGDYPISGVVRDSVGNLYGTTIEGGKYQDGVVFKLKLH